MAFFSNKKRKNHLIINTESEGRGELAWCPNSFVWDCRSQVPKNLHVLGPSNLFCVAGLQVCTCNLQQHINLNPVYLNLLDCRDPLLN